MPSHNKPARYSRLTKKQNPICWICGEPIKPGSRCYRNDERFAHTNCSTFVGFQTIRAEGELASLGMVSNMTPEKDAELRLRVHNLLVQEEWETGIPIPEDDYEAALENALSRLGSPIE